jgi:H+/Cl- antiporter ClcA
MEEIEDKLLPIVDKAIKAAESTGEFVIEQAPIILKEFYAWHTASIAFFVILGLLLTIFGGYIIKRFKKKESKGSIGDDDVIGAIFLGLLPFIGGIITLLNNLYDLLFILIAPRLYLIEFFAGKI